MFRIDEARFLELIRGETRGLAATLQRAGLSAAAVPYGLAVALRNAAFDHGLKAVRRSRLPIVSVGNITLGGTGKTPMVEWVCRWFRLRHRRVAILSRGYGANQGLNDEGLVLEGNLPDVPHLQDRDRVRLSQIADEELESQVLVLDDGFQHRRLGRDLDIVLLDALEPFGLGRLFPRGLLREPISALRRAGAVVLSRADQVDADRRRAIREAAIRRAGPLSWAEARHAPSALVNASGASLSPDHPRGLRVAAFCGIGNPEGFRRTLESVGAQLCSFRAFPDHHGYRAADIADLTAWAAREQPELILTTQKDLVKVRLDAIGHAPLYALRIGLEFLSGVERVEQALNAIDDRITSEEPGAETGKGIP